METQLVRIPSVFIVILTLVALLVTASAPKSFTVPIRIENADWAIPPNHPPAPVGSVSAALPSTGANQAHLLQSFGQLPLYFVENQGQLDERVVYYIQGSDKTIYFSPDGVTFALAAPLTPPLSQREREERRRFHGQDDFGPRGGRA